MPCVMPGVSIDACSTYNSERSFVNMAALSIKQPFASLVVYGLKTLEIRSRRTTHRGKLLICSSLKPYPDGMLNPNNRDQYIERAVDFLPQLGAPVLYGHAIGLVDVVGCRFMTPDDAKLALVPYRPGAYAWELANAVEIEPFPVSGQLGIFTVLASKIKIKYGLK